MVPGGDRLWRVYYYLCSVACSPSNTVMRLMPFEDSAKQTRDLSTRPSLQRQSCLGFVGLATNTSRYLELPADACNFLLLHRFTRNPLSAEGLLDQESALELFIGPVRSRAGRDSSKDFKPQRYDPKSDRRSYSRRP